MLGEKEKEPLYSSKWRHFDVGKKKWLNRTVWRELSVSISSIPVRPLFGPIYGLDRNSDRSVFNPVWFLNRIFYVVIVFLFS